MRLWSVFSRESKRSRELGQRTRHLSKLGKERQEMFERASETHNLLSNAFGRIANSLKPKNRPGYKKEPKVYSKNRKRR